MWRRLRAGNGLVVKRVRSLAPYLQSVPPQEFAATVIFESHCFMLSACRACLLWAAWPVDMSWFLWSFGAWAVCSHSWPGRRWRRPGITHVGTPWPGMTFHDIANCRSHLGLSN